MGQEWGRGSLSFCTLALPLQSYGAVWRLGTGSTERGESWPARETVAAAARTASLGPELPFVGLSVLYFPVSAVLGTGNGLCNRKWGKLMTDYF